MEVGRVAVVERVNRAERTMPEKKNVNWGLCPQAPGIFSLYRQDSWEAGTSCARTRRIPAGSALEVRPRRALSSAQVEPG